MMGLKMTEYKDTKILKCKKVKKRKKKKVGVMDKALVPNKYSD